MKVLLLSSFGGRVPKIIKKFVKQNDITWRVGEVIAFIEVNAINNMGMNPKSIKTKVIAYDDPDGNKSYLFNDDNIVCKIVDVDISRPWTIATYDGAEYIQYLDYQVINTTLNYCKYKN